MIFLKKQIFIFTILILFYLDGLAVCKLVSPSFSSPLVDNNGNVLVINLMERDDYYSAIQFNENGKFIKKILFEPPFKNAYLEKFDYIDDAGFFWLSFIKEVDSENDDT